MSEPYKVSKYTNTDLPKDGLPCCRWIVRYGTKPKCWALTTCKRGFNPLGKASTIDGLIQEYNGRYCPICGRPIWLDFAIMDGEEQEHEHIDKRNEEIKMLP